MMMAMAGWCFKAWCLVLLQVYPTNGRKCVPLLSCPEEIGDKAARC